MDAVLGLSYRVEIIGGGTQIVEGQRRSDNLDTRCQGGASSNAPVVSAAEKKAKKACARLMTNLRAMRGMAYDAMRSC